MKNGVRLDPSVINLRVQARLGRGLAGTRNMAAFEINLQQVSGSERSFIETARRNENAAVDPHAEVAARGRHPAARIAPPRRSAERFHLRLQSARIRDHTCVRSVTIETNLRPPHALYNESLLTEPQRDLIEIVLIAPRNPLNIGAVARAMANFGFTRLTVVSAYEPHWREARSAVGAPEVLQNAREAATFADAVADRTLIIGTGTQTYRKPEQSVVSLPDLGPMVAQELDRKGRIALVFGPEKHGLTREDLSWCHSLVEIPTHPRQPSMNLGQAVAVCLYELAVRALVPEQPSPKPARNRATPSPDSAASGRSQSDASSGDLDILAALIDDVMVAANYSPRTMQPANRHSIRLLLRRIRLNAADQRRLLGLFRRILWRLRRSPIRDIT